LSDESRGIIYYAPIAVKWSLELIALWKTPRAVNIFLVNYGN
jgi:hypothetical protein